MLDLDRISKAPLDENESVAVVLSRTFCIVADLVELFELFAVVVTVNSFSVGNVSSERYVKVPCVTVVIAGFVASVVVGDGGEGVGD